MEPYITPGKLLAGKSLPIKCDIAIICLCPMPTYFEQFKSDIQTDERLFVHLHPYHIMFCRHNNINFIVCAEIYGGPVCVSIVEELNYYGVKCILGLGFVGSFDKQFTTGNIIQVVKALSEPGTTPHYDKSEFIDGDDKIIELFKKDSRINSVIVWTTNAIYREYKPDIEYAKRLGCNVVNMDTSHLFASCKLLNITYGYFATVSDLMINESDWNNDLTNSIENGSQSQKILIDIILEKISIINDFMN
jgi:uridine phosphorylase